MTSSTVNAPAAPYRRYPREIAANTTLRAAASVLTDVARPLDRDAAVAVSTACAALATRVGLVRFLGAPAAARADPSSCAAFDAMASPGLPAELQGIGPEPGRLRLAIAGERLECVGDRWQSDLGSLEYHLGIAGSLALGAWCAWALDDTDPAHDRAARALAIEATDPIAGLVVRWIESETRPMWWG